MIKRKQLTKVEAIQRFIETGVFLNFWGYMSETDNKNVQFQGFDNTVNKFIVGNRFDIPLYSNECFVDYDDQND